MADRVVMPIPLDGNGNLVPNARAYFFAAGTTTPLTVYQDSAGTTPHASPVVASAGAFPAVFTTAALKVDIREPDGTSLPGYPSDEYYVTPSSTGASTIVFTPISGNAATNVQAAIANNTASIMGLDERVDNALTPVLTGGSGGAYTLTPTDALDAYATGQVIRFIANHANAGAATMNVGGLGDIALKRFNASGASAALAGGEIAAGGCYAAIYDGTDFVIFTPTVASETTSGLVELATTAERLAGTAGKAIDAAQHKAGIDAISFIKAWVNFNGTGTVAIRDSFNVASVTDNGTGDYTINFTDAMPDANYAVVGLASQNSGAFGIMIVSQAAGNVRIETRNTASNALADLSTICVVVFA